MWWSCECYLLHAQNNTAATSNTDATTEPITQPPSPQEPVDDDFNHNIVVFVLLGISLVLLLITIALHLGFR